MAIEVCPKCSQQAFVWLEEESAQHTNVWRCCACAYQAEETEETVQRILPESIGGAVVAGRL